jgi:serine/threonine-protein phosphatase 6 regulatory ankyrin repeat subunit A
LKENVDINYQDEEKRSPLHAAAFKGDANTTDLLIQKGARINIKDSKWLTPLHRACKSGNEVMK